MRLLVYNIRYGTGAGARFHLPVPFGGYLKHTDENLENITTFIKSYHDLQAAIRDITLPDPDLKAR